MDDLKALLHELEVHQVELQLQNEELRRAQQDLRASKDRYADLFDFAPVGYLTLDGHFQIVEANFAASQILDVERRELFRRRLTQYVMREYQDLFYQCTRMDGRSDCEFELMMHRREGARFYAELKIVKDPASGADVRYRVAITDITERKRLEAELKRSRDKLEITVQERTRELYERTLTLQERSEQLRHMTGQLALAEQSERQRLSKILHDGLQQILVAAKYRLVSAGRDADVHQATNEVQELLDQALETSRSLTAELSPPVLFTGNFVAALEWLANWMHDRQGLQVDLIAHGKIKRLTAEATLLLFQATRELLFNVVKHAGVKKACVEAGQFEGQIILSIKDEGVGFDPRRLHGESRQPGGIGLLGVQERISYIGGRLEIDSAPGFGSRFKVIVPISILAGDTESAIRAQEQTRISVMMSPESDSGQTGAGRRVRIMLVDDHPVMRQGLAGLLRGEPDFEVAGEASDGEAAVQLAREIRPDVVLMDISMPRMDGIEATRIIHQELQNVRIIGLSMSQEQEREAAIREAGAVGYISKSGPAEAVIDAVRSSVSDV